MNLNNNCKFKVRRGDTLRVPCLALDEDGNPCDLSIRDLASTLRAPTGEKIEPWAIEKSETKAGVFYIVGDYVETAKFPLGHADFDVEETIDGVRTSSESIRLDIIKDITHD